MGLEPDTVHLRTVIVDPYIDDVLGEDTSLKEELVVGCGRIIGLIERDRDG